MDNLTTLSPALDSNVIPFPSKLGHQDELEPRAPGYEVLLAEAKELDLLSSYKCDFDYGVYRDLELRFRDKPMNGGTVMKTVFRVGNSHSTCQQCLYTFEIDTYGRGCIHNCTYCYAKAELTVHGMWNNPIPVPIDLNEVRRVFYTVFETTRKTKWRSIMEKKIPLRIGSMSDSFMWSDQKYKVTQELLKILSFYKYPYIIFTRSDLVATDEYMNLLDPKLAAVQMSISSINDDLNKKIEPGAPSAKRRLAAMKKLTEAGFNTTVRINPLFPIYPDGYYTDPKFVRTSDTPKFEFSSFDMVDAIADHGIKSFLVGFGRFSRMAMNGIEQSTGVDLRPFFKKELIVGARGDFRFSDQEIRYYYFRFKERANARGIRFSTCYIGNGEGQFWRDQDLWSNKKDCCDVKGNLASFKNDSRSIPFETRLKFTSHKTLEPVDAANLHKQLGPASTVKPVPSPGPSVLQ
jgi:DNA repair photolyase